MLHILLWMLKILGILLAALLAVLLFGLICALFVPVRYRISAEGKLGAEQPVRAGVKVGWLLNIIRVAVAYPEKAETNAGTGIRIKVRILCFTVFDTAKKKKQERKKQERKKTQGKQRKKEENKNSVPLEYTKGGENTGEKPVSLTEDCGFAEGETQDSGNMGQAPESAGVPKGMLGKLKAFYLACKRLLLRLLAAFKNIEYTIRKICGKIRKIADDIRYYTEVLKSETFRGAWEVSKKQLFRIGRMLRPRVCRIRLVAGTGDPAGTGQLLAFYGILYPLVGNHVSVEADFEHKVMEGDLLLKGSVTIFVFLLAAFQLFVNKNIRRLLKMLKKEDM